MKTALGSVIAGEVHPNPHHQAQLDEFAPFGCDQFSENGTIRLIHRTRQKTEVSFDIFKGNPAIHAITEPQVFLTQINLIEEWPSLGSARFDANLATTPSP